MEESGKKKQSKKKVNEVKAFPVPFSLEEIKKTITSNTPSKPSKKQIMNQAIKFHVQGNILEAAKYYQYCLNQGFNDPTIFSNYGAILRKLGKLQEAEISLHKAIKVKPDFANAHSNLGNIYRDLGKLTEAELSTRKAIELNPNFTDAHNNLGTILIDLGQLQEAEISLRKAIEINPNYADAHLNLGSIFINFGKLQEAEISLRKAIEINPDLTKAYFSLSRLQYSNNKVWQEKLFSQSILNNKLKPDQVDIYFARANILHKRKNYLESAKYLELANNIKLYISPSDINMRIQKSRTLIFESDKQDFYATKKSTPPESIFIVGMPRSGSTLVESILSMNSCVDDLGEINILEESFLEQRKNNYELTLAELYWEKTNYHPKELKIKTNKWLYNYQYSGIIAKQIPNAKIIYCYRNPLDNILSIYRAHLGTGNQYSSSLVDCAKVYLDQEEIMTKYKNRFRSKIYDLNYDSLVSDANHEIKSLIHWLGWKWDDSYLSPHLNPRSVSTASNIQVRSAIHSKSIGGWENYKDMLKPAIEILSKNDRYRELIS